jgi:hypothetical protein
VIREGNKSFPDINLHHLYSTMRLRYKNMATSVSAEKLQFNVYNIMKGTASIASLIIAYAIL